MDWDLISWSFTVLRRNKQLALFPVFSALVALAGLWFASAWRFGSLERMSDHRLTVADYLWGAPVLFLVSFVIIFFNCALAACANAELSGRRASVADASVKITVFDFTCAITRHANRIACHSSAVG